MLLESFNLESPASGLSTVTATVVCEAKRARDPPERVSINMFNQTRNATAQARKTWRSVEEIVWDAMDNKRSVLSVEVELKYVVADSEEEEELQEEDQELEDDNFPVFAIPQGPVTKKRKVG
jgi:flagellar basal body-associated protein FliL